MFYKLLLMINLALIDCKYPPSRGRLFYIFLIIYHDFAEVFVSADGILQGQPTFDREFMYTLGYFTYIVIADNI
ncbi:hypothetical protein I3843_15G118100 [Carya illinoinensis]|nr:hypothetical protein I3843_15G118100 [Carya illinoinensis]